MAPSFRQDPELAGVHGKPCREAAVLVLFFPLQGEPALVLTVRHADLRQHAGQIAFPGGRRDPGETLMETALREAREEIGLETDAVEILGRLTPLYIPPSNFCVTPFVGAVRHVPDLLPQDAEVEVILHVPVSHLLDPGMHLREPWTLHGRRVVVPYFAVDDYKVWGATAMMLAELLALFDDTA